MKPRISEQLAPGGNFTTTNEINFSERLTLSIARLSMIGLTPSDAKACVEIARGRGGRMPMNFLDSNHADSELSRIKESKDILSDERQYTRASSDTEYQRACILNGYYGQDDSVSKLFRPESLRMPSYFSLRLASLGSEGFADKTRINRLHKADVLPEHLGTELDCFADYTHILCVSNVLNGAASLVGFSNHFNHEIRSWVRKDFGNLFSDDRVAYRDAIDGLQRRLDGLSQVRQAGERVKLRISAVSENLETIRAVEERRLEWLDGMWRVYVGEDYAGEEPHFVQEMDRLAQETKRREEEAQNPVSRVPKEPDEHKLARQQEIEAQARAKAAARAARAAEEQAARKSVEAEWAQLQPDIAAYQAAAREYNRTTRCNGEAEKLRELQRMLVVGYGPRNTGVEGIDKKLATDVIKLLVKVDTVDVQELTELYQKLAPERERLLQESRRLQHGNDVELTRLTDVPSAVEYIKSNYEALRGLLIRNWPNERGLTRDRELWRCLFPDKEYNVPPGFMHESVADTPIAKPVLREEAGPKNVVPPAPDPNDSKPPPIEIAPTSPREDNDTTTSEETTPAPATPAVPLPPGAAGTFSELPFTPFRIGERRLRTGFDEIDLSDSESDSAKLAKMKKITIEQVEDYLARNKGKQADWGRLQLLLQIPRIFGADDAEFFRTARGGFTAIPPYFVAAFTAYGKPVCVADSPITGNAIYLFRDDIDAGTWQEMIEELTKGEARELGAVRAVHSGSTDDVRNNVMTKINDLLTIS
jgi:hypothetical protein